MSEQKLKTETWSRSDADAMEEHCLLAGSISFLTHPKTICLDGATDNGLGLPVLVTK